MNVFPTNYQAYLRDQYQQKRAYATGNPVLDFFGNAGKTVNDSILGTANAIQQTVGGEANAIQQNQATQNQKIADAAGGASNDVQTRVQKGVVKTQQDAENIAHIGYNLQVGAGDATASTFKFFQDAFGSFGQYLPYIAVGGAVLVLILVLKK